MINIALCLDDNYFEPSYLLINSILQTNKNSNICFYIVFDNLTDKHIEDFSSLSNDYIKFVFHKINEEDFSFCPIRPGDHVSLATYYRILLPVFLPETVKKVLYLDGDMLCFNSIKELYETDISENSFAACYDSQCFNTERKKLINLKDSSPYFAAGVLLINLDYWRKNEIHLKAMEYIKENTEKLLWHDQDTLNAVLEGTIKKLSFRYNFYETYFKKREKSTMTDTLWEEVLESKKSICLMHYSQSEKPWFVECYHPLRDIWRDYYKRIFHHKPKLKFKYSGRARFSFLKRKVLSTIFRFSMNENYEPLPAEIKQNLEKALGL